MEKYKEGDTVLFNYTGREWPEYRGKVLTGKIVVFMEMAEGYTEYVRYIQYWSSPGEAGVFMPIEDVKIIKEMPI